MVFRYLFISIALVLLIFIGGVERERQQKKAATRVILLSVESLRQDMVNSDSCPKLLEAAKSGYTFTNHRSISGWTGTNFVSLLSGLSPFQSGVHTRGQSITPGLHLPLKQLKKRGYTVAGLQPFMAMELYKNLGLELQSAEPEPLLWLGGRKKENQPFFLWYHYVHTHLPYTQKYGWQEDLKKSGIRDLAQLKRLEMAATQTAIHFNETRFHHEDVPLIHRLQRPNIKEFDQWFGKFWQFFQKGGLYRDTILIVTADHGDSHGERGLVGHASTTLQGNLHDEIVHVPLFIWLPEHLKKQKPSQISSQPSSHLDIMPTLCDLLGLRPDLPMKGHSLFTPGQEGSDWAAMTSSGGFAEPEPQRMRYFEYSYLQDNWKSRIRLYRNGKIMVRLYNLARDPAEENDIKTEHPEILEQHVDQLVPRILNQKFCPVLEGVSASNTPGSGPAWIFPPGSGSFSYDDLQGDFSLNWQGERSRHYILQYRAGLGPKALEGSLHIDGNQKKFGKISRRYWNTWIVPQSPIFIRIREEEGVWGDWLRLEAVK